MKLLKRRIQNLDLNPKKEDLEEKAKPTDKFLEAKTPQCVLHKKQLQLMQWIYSRWSTPTDLCNLTHIRRKSLSDKAQKSRICPQWATSYNEEERALSVWIVGTQNDWDWKNLLNVCHHPVHLQSPEEQTIWVHRGVYNAINNMLFYAPLFADIHIHFSDPNQPIDRVIFGGHSQGAGIALLMFILWHGQVRCAFTDYFRTKMSDLDSAVAFDPHSVYTLGAVSVVAHRSAEWVDRVFGGSILNVIHPIDPIPRMYGGNKNEPDCPLKVTQKLGFSRMCINKYGQALMDRFPEIASFGPIGRYIVSVYDEFRVLRRDDDELGLFREHLVDGAHSFTKTKAWCDLPTLIEVQKCHLYGNYIENLERIFSRYIADLDRKSGTVTMGDDSTPTPLALSGDAVSALSVNSVNSVVSMDDEA